MVVYVCPTALMYRWVKNRALWPCVTVFPYMRCFRTAPLWTASVSVRFPFFSSSPKALGTINPTDYSAPLLLDCTFTISRGCQQWGPDESNIHGISFTLLPLSHAPPPLCQAPVWWEGLLTLAAPIDRQFCNDNPQTTTNAPPLALQFAPVVGDKTREPSCLPGSNG